MSFRENRNQKSLAKSFGTLVTNQKVIPGSEEPDSESADLYDDDYLEPIKKQPVQEYEQVTTAEDQQYLEYEELSTDQTPTTTENTTVSTSNLYVPSSSLPSPPSPHASTATTRLSSRGDVRVLPPPWDGMF